MTTTPTAKAARLHRVARLFRRAGFVLIGFVAFLALNEIYGDDRRRFSLEAKAIVTAASHETHVCIMPGERILSIEGDPLLNAFVIRCGFTFFQIGDQRVFMRGGPGVNWIADSFPLGSSLQLQWDAAQQAATNAR